MIKAQVCLINPLLLLQTVWLSCSSTLLCLNCVVYETGLLLICQGQILASYAQIVLSPLLHADCAIAESCAVLGMFSIPVAVERLLQFFERQE